MERASNKHTTSSPPPPKDEPKPNGSGGDPFGAALFTPELAAVSEALSMFSTDVAQLGQSRWEQIGAAVWCATEGSEEGLELFNEWSKTWQYYSPEDARRRWESCAAYPPAADPDLFTMAEKVRERNRALEEATHLDDLSYAEQKKALKKKTGLDAETLDKERKRRRKRGVEPPPKPRPPPIEELAIKAKDLIAAENILDLFVEDISPRLAGAKDGSAELLYLACTSRLFDKPMSVVNKGESAAGKSYERDCVFAYIPDEDILHMTTMSDQAITYLPDDMAHKILSIAEAAGVKDRESQEYMLREIISDGRITRLVAVGGSPGELPTTQTVVKEGPIMFVTTTTLAHLHHEIETRVLSIEANDSEAHTRRVVEKVADLDGGLIDVTKVDPMWADYQRWLTAGERRVVIPFARNFARHKNLYVKSVRMRRDFRQVLTTVKAHALLHREHRKRDDKGRIVATRFDYEVAYELLEYRLAQGAGVAFRDNEQRVFNAIKTLQEDLKKEEGVKVADLMIELKLSQPTVNRRLAKLITNYLVENLNPGKGKTGRYRANDKIRERFVLPDPDDLFSQGGVKKGE